MGYIYKFGLNLLAGISGIRIIKISRNIWIYHLSLSNLFQSLIRLNQVLCLTRFNHFDSTVLFFAFPVEDGEIRPQSHFVGYDWLEPKWK